MVIAQCCMLHGRSAKKLVSSVCTHIHVAMELDLLVARSVCAY